MFIFIVLVALICVAVFWLPFRIAILHPVSDVVYAVRDSIDYFRKKRYNYYNAGKLDCYCAHFGGGKTLSIVHYVTWAYQYYNNKLVWDSGLGCFVRQRIHVISNVSFNTIPYQPLEGLDQIVNLSMYNKDLDKKTLTRTVTLVVIDEASAQLNSRSFKSNIDPNFLNTLITSRHYHISILYSSQKFKLTDKLMRDVTQRVIVCKKIWRFMCQYEYDADQLEYASDPTLVRPFKRTGFFVRNKDFNAYDTLAVVGSLKKSVDKNDMLSEKEILDLRASMVDNDSITNPSRKLRRKRKAV